MKNLFLLLFLLFIVGSGSFVQAQKISDGQTIDVNGMSVTFNILNKESVQAGGKTFDRYKVAASVKNTSNTSYNVRLSSYPQIVNNIGLVELDCINATGAKLTSKRFS